MAEISPFRLEIPVRGYDALFEQMKLAIPQGAFYDFTRPIVNYTKDPVLFQLYTDVLNQVVKVSVEREGDYFDGVDQANLITESTLVTLNNQNSFYLTLGKGKNKITAIEEGGRTAYIEVVATTNTLFLEAYGREISKPLDVINRQSTALFSKYSTKLLDQAVNFQDLLPDIQSLKVLSSKLLTRSLVHYPATELGTLNLAQSLTLNTPVFKQMRQNMRDSKITEYTLLRNPELDGGVEAHIWYPNRNVTKWLAFVKMADTFRDLYEILDITDDMVMINYKGALQIHRFSYEENALYTGASEGCFNNIDLSFNFYYNSVFTISNWAYRFDEFVTETSAIGNDRVSFDLGIPFDSNRPFDADPVDPFTDGWVNWSLTGRFDHDTNNSETAQHGLDTHQNPSSSYPNQNPVYKGAYTQLLNSSNFLTEIDVVAEAEGEFTDYTQGAIVGLGLDLPIEDYFVAGVPVLAYAKYVDSNYMTVNAGSGGSVVVTEPVSGLETYVPVVNGSGFQAFYFTPTKAGENIQYLLSDGTYNGVSLPQKVVAGPVAGLQITGINDLMVGEEFPVDIQAVDAYGNSVTDVGINNKVTLNPQVPFPADSVEPAYIELYQGKATVSLKMLEAGTGRIKFTLGTFSTLSNEFMVLNP